MLVAGDADCVRSTSAAQRALFALLLAAAVATSVGMAILAPAHRTFRVAAAFTSGGRPLHTVPARVEKVAPGYCGISDTGQVVLNPPSGQGSACVLATVRLLGGATRGTSTQLQLTPGPGTPPVSAGERIRVYPTGAPVGPAYVFADFDRHRSLLLLGILAAWCSWSWPGCAGWRPSSGSVRGSRW